MASAAGAQRPAHRAGGEAGTGVLPAPVPAMSVGQQRQGGSVGRGSDGAEAKPGARLNICRLETGGGRASSADVDDVELAAAEPRRLLRRVSSPSSEEGKEASVTVPPGNEAAGSEGG